MCVSECMHVCACLYVYAISLQCFIQSSLTLLQSLLLFDFILQIQPLQQYFILSHVTEPGPFLLQCVYFVCTWVYTFTLWYFLVHIGYVCQALLQKTLSIHTQTGTCVI